MFCRVAMFGLLVWLVTLGGQTSRLVAADPVTGFVTKVHKNADGSVSPYVVFVPHTYDGEKPVPVILFLHGAGETRGGVRSPVDQGIGNHIRGRREPKFPAIVVFPQSEKKTWKAESDDGQRAIAILETVMKEYKTDPDRVYLTGLSMGGAGTWSFAAAYPDRWAAIVPICGGVKESSEVKPIAEKIKDIPCWVFHGDKDGAVGLERSRELVAALKAAGGNPRYTEFPYVGHNSWDPAYATQELYDWMFAQKKKSK